MREMKGISLEQIAATSKISLRYLRAIEEERFEKLPGGIFAVSYIRQYAEAIGCAEGEILACYHARRRSAAPESPFSR
jgi:cytoskeletal protein RodZ